MIGAIAGDIIGSVYEWNNIKTKDFSLFAHNAHFTDDTILTVALADSILTGTPYAENLRRFHDWYPRAGYGGSFRRWANDPDAGPYNSWGNGAAMRISPVGYAYNDMETVLEKAREFTEITHNHPEGIKGGQATAAAIFLAREGKTKDEIKDFVEQRFQYDLSKHVDIIRPAYTFDVSSQGTVPQAIRAFYDSTDFDDAIRIAVSLGGDCDTLTCITGGIAQAFYGGVPEQIQEKVYEILDERLKNISRRFVNRYCNDILNQNIIYNMNFSKCSSITKYKISIFEKDMNNRYFFDYLVHSGKINIQNTPFFNLPPLNKKYIDYNRFTGMMLGLAIGDGIGNTTEGLLPSARREKYGEIKHYISNKNYNHNPPLGGISDDTQLAFWTLEQILIDDKLIPENLASRFSRERIFGIGGTVKKFLKRYKSGMSWECCGLQSAGNGSLMRIAPVLYPHLNSRTCDLWIDTALATMITHNDRASISACLSFTKIYWELLQMDHPPAPEWWLNTYVNTAKDLEGDSTYISRSKKYSNWRGPLWRFVQEKVSEAWENNMCTIDACNSWHSGAYLLETVPSALYILMRHGHNFEDAVIRSVNDTKDNDTIAAIVGAAAGALHGKQAIPEMWITNLAGRASFDEPDLVFSLIDRAEHLYIHGVKSCHIEYAKDYENDIKIGLFNIDNGEFAGVARLIVTDFFQLILPDKKNIKEKYECCLFYPTFERICKKIEEYGLALKACGQCRYFGFSGITAQFSNERAGYCTVMKFNDGSSYHLGPKKVIDYCYKYSYRKGRILGSPYLSA